MADQATIPHRGAPTAQSVQDAHRLAHFHASRSAGRAVRGCAAAFDWATEGGPTPLAGVPAPPGEDGALQLLAAAARLIADDAQTEDQRQWACGVTDTLIWLLGWTPTAPVRLPHRHPD